MWSKYGEALQGGVLSVYLSLEKNFTMEEAFWIYILRVNRTLKVKSLCIRDHGFEHKW